MEGGATHFDVSIPKACGVVCPGGYVEDVKPIRAAAGDLLGVELPAGIEEFDGDGVVSGDAPLAIAQHEGEVERVARSPDAALAVDEALEPAHGLLAAHVEAAEHVLFALHEAQVALLLA